MVVLLLFSFLAGLITVLSPCILPVLPILLSVGVGAGRYRPLGIIVGLVLSFSFFTLAFSVIIQATGLSPDLLRYIALGIIFCFGLTMLFPALGTRFATMTASIASLGSALQEKAALAGTGFLSGTVLGSALGLIWTPCAGPILASITTIVATGSVTGSAIVLTLAYSIGAALPMLIIIYGGNQIMALAGYSELIRQIFGALMMLGALAIVFHADVILQQLAIKYFPMITIENNDRVRKDLDKLLAGARQDERSILKDSERAKKNNAPDFVGIRAWINSPELSIEKLRGKVVLVDFWTYSCINCIRTLPYLKKWYETYKDKGLVIVGVHTPEFEFEKSVTNVQAAVKRFAISYPVAVDSDYKTWQNYNNHYWPAHFLIDQQGVIQESHYGEGGYADTENAIRKLLGLGLLSKKDTYETGKQPSRRSLAGRFVTGSIEQGLTPETYLGYQRAENYQQELSLKRDHQATYGYNGPLDINQVGLRGLWLVGKESIESKSNTSTLDINFIANKVHLVMQSATPQVVTVLLDGKPVPTRYYTSDVHEHGQLLVHESRLYDILDLKDDYERHKLSLQCPAGVMAYAFTFGDRIQ